MKAKLRERVETTRDRLTIAGLVKPGEWIMKPHVFRAFMSSDESDLFCYLLNVEHATAASLNVRRRKGWFYCKMKKLCHELFMNERQQSRLFASLIEKGLITTERKGQPPLRWIKVHSDVLVDMIDEAMESREPFVDDEELEDTD